VGTKSKILLSVSVVHLEVRHLEKRCLIGKRRALPRIEGAAQPVFEIGFR